MPPQNMTLKVLGRPVKPVALGLLIICLTVVWSELAHVGMFADSLWSLPLTVLATGTSVLFAWGWWARSQAVAEWALLAAAATMIFRSTGLLLLNRSTCFMAFGVGVIAVGSYLLERTDQTTGGDRRAA